MKHELKSFSKICANVISDRKKDYLMGRYAKKSSVVELYILYSLWVLIMSTGPSGTSKLF